MEGDHRALRSRVQAFDPGIAAQTLDRHDLEQVFHLLRQRPEAVDELGREGLDLLAVDQAREAPIEP